VIRLLKLVFRQLGRLIPSNYHSRRDRLSRDGDQLASMQSFRGDL
jgi:hypothetical protein